MLAFRSCLVYTTMRMWQCCLQRHLILCDGIHIEVIQGYKVHKWIHKWQCNLSDKRNHSKKKIIDLGKEGQELLYKKCYIIIHGFPESLWSKQNKAKQKQSSPFQIRNISEYASLFPRPRLSNRLDCNTGYVLYLCYPVQ